MLGARPYRLLLALSLAGCCLAAWLYLRQDTSRSEENRSEQPRDAKTADRPSMTSGVFFDTHPMTQESTGSTTPGDEATRPPAAVLNKTEPINVLVFDAAGRLDGEQSMMLAREVWTKQDEVMLSWPPYEEVYEELKRELMSDPGLEKADVDALRKMAVALLDQYWASGGDLSTDSYAYVYKARLLLETAHARKPGDMTIVDELVEAISAGSFIWSDMGDHAEHVQHQRPIGALLKLRLAQYQQAREEVAKGREPTFQDFMCACDTAFLLTRADGHQPQEASEVFGWLRQEAARGHWTSYSTHFAKCQADAAKGDGPVNFNVWLVPPTQEYSVGMYRFGRRLPSFRSAARACEGLFVGLDQHVYARSQPE